MLALVRRARRRLLQNELLAQAANAASAALLTLILLLLLGTEILNWQFVILIPALALAGGVWLARRRTPGAYRTAQIIDQRLGLADTLSTAVYYRESATKGSPDVIRFQAETAERAAASVDLRRALPYSMPRAAYAMAALFVVAGSLFALRYGVTRQLDLKAPLASILRQTFGLEQPKTEQAKAKQPKTPKPDAAPDSELASAEEQQIRSGDRDGNSEQADENEQPGKAESLKADGSSKRPQDSSAQAESEQQEGNEDRPGNDGENANPGQQGKQQGKQGNQKDPNNSGDNNSLMSKVKDAVQNLLSKMKPQNQSGGQQQSAEQKGQQGKGQQKGGKQQSAKNGQQQQGGEQSDGDDAESGEQAQNSQDQQGKGQGNSDSKQASKQPGSGVGSQDGDKRVKQAEQLAAMGKISEIIGKRSQTLTGETTVEVQQTSQTLRTQYTNRTAQHTQGGAEINRDEVPVALQSYVESYFEQVRKQAPPAPKK